MQTIFNDHTAKGLTTRIAQLSPNSKALWGKMNCYQMLKHCTLSEEMFHRKQAYPRLFIGRLFGKIALNSIIKDDAPAKKNQPTHPALKIKTNGDVEAEKEKWVNLLNAYSTVTREEFMHPFFGSMTADQIGRFVYKHTDHHLRQFGC